MPFLSFKEETFLVCKDHTVSGELFELKKDKKFGLLGTFPRPEKDKLPEYYKSEKYISHTDSKISLFDKTYQWVKSIMLRKKIMWIQAAQKGKGQILDIGAGTGDFLLEAKKSGWEVNGVEPNPDARKLAAQKGVSLESDSSYYTTASFDVITLWHVLEHVPDLEKQINELLRLLKRDGLLIVAVPNFKSYDAKKYGEHWAAYDVPRHLYHFSQTSIEAIFQSFTFRLVDKKPLKFDPFYVSMLSEKYRSGRSNPLRAFVIGSRSNLRARSTGEYSSLAYFFRTS